MTTLDVLARKLEETHGEIVQVRCEVIEALRAFYSNVSGISVDEAIKIASKWTASRHHSYDPQLAGAVPKSDLQERIQRLNDALLSTVDQLQLGGSQTSAQAPQAKLVYSFTQRERLKRQMEQSKEMISLIEKLTEIDRILGEIDAFLDNRQLVQAAQAVKDAQRLLTALLSEEASKTQSQSMGAQEQISKIIQLQILKKKNQLMLKLKQIHATTILWKDGALRVSKASTLVAPLNAGGNEDELSSSQEQLRDFWQACEIMGVLPDRLKELAKALAQHLIKPSLQTANALTSVSRDANGAVLKLVRGGGADDANKKTKSEVLQVEEKCSNIVSSLYFVHAEVFLNSSELMSQLGEFLWKIPGNLEAQLMTLLQEKIPQDATALNSYRDTLSIGVRELEDKLLAIGFTACANSQLRTFVQQLHELYAKKRRQNILIQGREMMSRGYNDSIKISGATERCNLEASVGSGKKSKGGGSSNGSSISANGGTGDVEGGAFQVPNYRISTCAHDVVELAHQTLIEGCTSESKCANLLFQTSRDLLFLFRAVVPTLYESDIANDPRTCMLYHNDCLYIAYHMLTVGHQYKHRLPAPLNRTGTMVDMVPAFREAGEKALITYAKGQTDEMVLSMTTLPAFGDVESDTVMVRIEDFLKSALYKLTRISSFWREGLPLAVYHKITGLMVSPLVAGFVERVFAASKISANAGAQLHHLSSMLLESENLFDSPGQAEKHVPSMAKLRKLVALLMEPLTTIRDQFHAGNLAVFANRELAHLVRSLHRDSQEKKEFLNVLH